MTGAAKQPEGPFLSAVFDSPEGHSVHVSKLGRTQTYPYNIDLDNKTGSGVEETHDQLYMPK